MKPTLTETDRENISNPSKCFYFTCVRKILYNTLFFKVLYLFVKIAQHKQDTIKKREKITFFKIQEKTNKCNATFWTSEALCYMQRKN